MIRTTGRGRQQRRRGVIAVLAAVFLIGLLAMIAFAIDIGYIALTQTQLQVAADSAALAAAGVTNDTSTDVIAVAQRFANSHVVAGRNVDLKSSDVQFGTWDVSTRTFTQSSGINTAVKVTVRTNSDSGGSTGLFFAPMFGVSSVDQTASAVATVNPRDICFVIDLSGSMNDDTNPGNTASLNSKYSGSGYPTIGTDIVQNVFDDLGYGTYNPNSTGTAKTYGKTNAWIIDNQIPLLMPAALPTPRSTNSASYSYWSAYISAYGTKLGYNSYVQFMMDYASDGSPNNSGLYSPLSLKNANCPMHTWTTAGGPFLFPPREMPMHAGRKAVIAALQLIKDRNASITDLNQRDWVSIISFGMDTASTSTSVIQRAVRHSLDSDYDSAMSACTTLQACYANTATEVGLVLAASHLKPTTEGGYGRLAANKVVVLVTDGMPNLAADGTTYTTVSSYIAAHPNTNYYNTYAKWKLDAALIATAKMQLGNWYLYPVGIGLGCDYDFMDRAARLGGTANTSGQCSRGSGNPAEYEDVLTNIFTKIITNPKLRLVQ